MTFFSGHSIVVHDFMHLSATILVAALLGLSGIELSAAPVKIFFDTDMTTDCDDAGAMAVLHALSDRGECEILATVTSVRDPLALATVDLINRYRGRPELPLGWVKGEGVLMPSKFSSRLAAEFPHNVTSPESFPDAVEVYREILENQPDNSVVLVTVGYLTNVRRFLQSPGGTELALKKVAKWVCMGGNFIGDPPKDDLKLGNVNFQRDAISAHYAIHHWTGQIVFAGREVCSVPSGLAIGSSLINTPEDNPVRRAYEHYFNGTVQDRHVADLATVLFAVRGLTDCWDLSGRGRMDLRDDMTFQWVPDPAGKQAYLLKKYIDGQPNDPYVESVLEELLVRPRGGNLPDTINK
jgi:Inosine-uridine preferring nucleoside hydrolase